MEQLFPFLGHWAWWVAAAILLLLELLTPGVFLMWLGIAAALTGLIDAVFDMPWQAEFLVFAVLAVISVYAGKAVYKRQGAEPRDNPHLNRRQLGYVGRSFTLQHPIVDGHGKLSVEDTLWEIEGPDLDAGTHVKVTAVRGMSLIVEPIPH
jgi:hypothetical protein